MPATVVACVGGSLFLVFISRMPFGQYFLPVLVVFSLTAALFFQKLWNVSAKSDDISPRRFVSTLVALAMVQGLFFQFLRPDNQFNRAVSERLRQITRPDEAVLASPPNHPIYRQDAGFLWFNVPHFLSAIEQMEKQGKGLSQNLVSKMREVLARPPAAVFVKDPSEISNVPGLAAYLGSHLHEDDTVRGLFSRKKQQ